MARARKMSRLKWRWPRHFRIARIFHSRREYTVADDDLPRRDEEIARRLGKLGLTWVMHRKPCAAQTLES